MFSKYLSRKFRKNVNLIIQFFLIQANYIAKFTKLSELKEKFNLYLKNMIQAVLNIVTHFTLFSFIFFIVSQRNK